MSKHVWKILYSSDSWNEGISTSVNMVITLKEGRMVSSFNYIENIFFLKKMLRNNAALICLI